MSWLVDTNVLSELRKGDRANAGVRAWFASADEAGLWTSVLVVGELRQGIEAVRRRDPAAAEAIAQWLERLCEGFRDRILPVDLAVARRWGTIGVPDPVPTIDGLLAATALVHDLVLVTRNVRDVAGTGVRMLDPFAA